MIAVTKMNNDPINLNAELIESVEARPDTLITLTTGNRIMVKEKVNEVVEKIIEYRKSVNTAQKEKVSKLTEERNE